MADDTGRAAEASSSAELADLVSNIHLRDDDADADDDDDQDDWNPDEYDSDAGFEFDEFFKTGKETAKGVEEEEEEENGGVTLDSYKKTTAPYNEITFVNTPIAGLDIRKDEKGAFANVTFTECTFENARFHECDFASANFLNCHFRNTTLAGVKIRYKNLVECRFDDCLWQNVNLVDDIENDENVIGMQFVSSRIIKEANDDSAEEEGPEGASSPSQPQPQQGGPASQPEEANKSLDERQGPGLLSHQEMVDRWSGVGGGWRGKKEKKGKKE